MATIKHGDGLLRITVSEFPEKIIQVVIEKQHDSGVAFNKMELYFNEKEYASFIQQFER